MTKRHLVIWSLGLFTVCGAVTASAQPRWGRERMPQGGACFFEDINFGGRYFCVQPGDDLRSMPRGMGDEVSSIRLLGGSEVTVFRDSNMRGRSARFTRDVNDLRRGGWNDQVSSIAVLGTRYTNSGNGNGRAYGRDDNRVGENRGVWDPNRAPVWGRAVLPREGACFYEDAGFRGNYFCVPRGGSYTSLPRGFNDRISSIRTFGANVRIYQDREFRGHSTEVRRDSGNLRGSWGDTVSSIRVF
jgi:hypothetical protein